MEKISFRKDGSVVSDRDLYNFMTNSLQQANLLVDVEETITNSQISSLKKCYKEMFEDSCPGQSAKEVHNAFIQRLQSEIDDFKRLRNQYRYGFVKPLAEVIDKMNQLIGVYPSLYSKTKAIEDATDDKLDIADEIRNFISSKQFDIFVKVDHIKNANQANLAYVASDLTASLDSIFTSKTPWKQMTQANTVIDAIHKEITERQEAERKNVLDLIDAKKQAIISLPTYAQIQESLKSQIDALWTTLTKKASDQRYIGNLIAMTQEVNNAYNTAIDLINHWIEEEERKRKEAEERAKQAGAGATMPVPTPQPAKVVHKVVNKQKAMNVPFAKPRLETKEDVAQYIEALRKQLENFIEQDNYIMLN
jgi:hypothetical protein